MHATRRILLVLMATLAAAGFNGCRFVWTSGDHDRQDRSPTVDAGPDQVVASGSIVILSATVTDDGTPAIAWRQTSGTPVVLSSPAAASTAFTAPLIAGLEVLVFEVSADDGVNPVVADSVAIAVSDAAAGQS